MKQLTEQIVKTNEYFTTGKYVPAAVNPDLKLPNCTTFCMCAWHWVFDAKESYKLFDNRGKAGFGNAKEWYDHYIFSKGPSPKVAAFACWDGTYGHVAFVKSFTALQDGYYKIDVYESYYKKFIFREHTYTVKVGIANSLDGLGKFKGFGYHPYYKEEDPEPTPVAPEYTVGKTYKTNVILNVRNNPSTATGRIKKYSELTNDAQKHAYPPTDPKNTGRLKVGTEVTCREVRKVGNDIWIRIPSGWICAYCKDDGEYVS